MLFVYLSLSSQRLLPNNCGLRSRKYYKSPWLLHVDQFLNRTPPLGNETQFAINLQCFGIKRYMVICGRTNCDWITG